MMINLSNIKINNNKMINTINKIIINKNNKINKIN